MFKICRLNVMDKKCKQKSPKNCIQHIEFLSPKGENYMRSNWLVSTRDQNDTEITTIGHRTAFNNERSPYRIVSYKRCSFYACQWWSLEISLFFWIHSFHWKILIQFYVKTFKCINEVRFYKAKLFSLNLYLIGSILQWV